MIAIFIVFALASGALEVMGSSPVPFPASAVPSGAYVAPALQVLPAAGDVSTYTGYGG